MTAVRETAPRTRSLEHLEARLALLEARVRAAVARRRASDSAPDDLFRGLYLSEAAIDGLLVQPEPEPEPSEINEAASALALRADEWEQAGAQLRLRSMARSFGLDETDLELLLVALAPDLDPRFESFYAYLNDDVTRRRASVGLSLELAGLSTVDPHARGRLSGHGGLVRHGLVVVDGTDRPVLSRSLRVRDRVAAHLLGSDLFDPELDQIVVRVPLDASHPPVVQALAAGIRTIYLREEGAASGLATGVGSVLALGARALPIDAARLATSTDPIEMAAEAIREARLSESVLVVGSIDALSSHVDRVVRQLAESGWPAIIVGTRPWDPAWTQTVPLCLEAPPPDTRAREARWLLALRGSPEASNGHARELVQATGAFRLGVAQIDRAAEAGRLFALAEGRPLEPADLRAGARAQNSAGLERLARRISPSAGWADLVLPVNVGSQLRELAGRARHRDRVLDDWQVAGSSSRGRGITALFGGESGTGKTLAAEVIAGELGLDLYVIDLSTVIDKYIGETEKNLDRIFTEAARVNGVLLFDEADAIFGKRSEVRDARDRYANVEVAYLLQRMERFDGLAILTTNLRANLDDAFTRRLDVIIDFPMPGDASRLALWRMHLPERLPQAHDIDLDFLARQFRVSGGHVRNICMTAAFLAAERDAIVSMEDLIRGTEREYRKLGRLTLEDEFGPYFAVLAADRQPIDPALARPEATE